MKVLVWALAVALALGACGAGVAMMVLGSNAALADETAAASEKRAAELAASWRNAAPGAAAFVVFDDFDTSGPRRIAGGSAARALWRSFSKRLGVVQEPAVSARRPMVLDFRTPALMRAGERERQIARMALAMRAVADAGGRVHVVARGAPAARAASAALERGGVRAGRFVALGTRALDYEGIAAPPADDFVAAFIEGSPRLRAERRSAAGAWSEAPIDFSGDPLETAVDLAEPKAPLVQGRWRGQRLDPRAPFELFLEQDAGKLSGRIEQPDPRTGRIAGASVQGRAQTSGELHWAAGGFEYRGRLSTDAARIEGKWTSGRAEGAFSLASAPNLRTIVVVPRAELEKNMARGREPAPAPAAAPPVAAGPDVRGEWEGTMRGATTAKAFMKLQTRATPATTTGIFRLSGAELGVELDAAPEGGVELRFPSEGGAIGCAGTLYDRHSALRASCGMSGERFTLTLKRRKR